MREDPTDTMAQECERLHSSMMELMLLKNAMFVHRLFSLFLTGFCKKEKNRRGQMVVSTTSCWLLTFTPLTLERECQVVLGEVLLGTLQALTFANPVSIGSTYFSPIMALFTEEEGDF